MSISTNIRHHILSIYWEGRVKTYEEYLEFKDMLTQTIQEYIDNPSESIRGSFTHWRIVLLEAYPFNTYALGWLLKLRTHDGYEFRLTTDDYRLSHLLEIIEFHRIFEMSLEHNPR